MSQLPVLTLVVTAHHTRYLTEALTSVAAQTDTAADLICCTDTTGQDGTAPLVRAFLPHLRFSSVRILEIAGGTAGRVRNAGFAVARTPWVTYLDGDDLLRPDALARLQTAIATTSADIISTGMTRITAEGTPQPWPQSLTYQPPRWIYRIDPDTVGHPTFFNQLLAIRRELWAAYPFPEETNGEDIDFMLHQLLAGRFTKLPEPLYGYRDTAASFSTRDYPGGDICTRRYASGYYARLFAQRYRPDLATNFTNEAEPQP